MSPKVYLFINGGKGTDWVTSIAMAEDGTFLASHVSSHDEWAKGELYPCKPDIFDATYEPVEDAHAGTTGDPAKCQTHDEIWQEGTPCACGGRRVWHSGLGETTTDKHWMCQKCGKGGYVDGIDS